MKYKHLDAQLFVENRHQFLARMKPGSVAVFHSNDMMPTSADGTMPFVQHSDLFYLTGIDQEETILILTKDAREAKYQEVLFLRETNEQIATWEGEKFTKEQSRELSGIQTVMWTKDFEATLRRIVVFADHIYLNTNEHLRATVDVQTRDDRFRHWCMAQFPLHRYERSSPILMELRAVKSKWEIEAIAHACQITEQAFRRVLGFVKPGVWEFEIEAEIWHEFIRNRSRRPAYEMIIASGKNACILHYVANENQCQAGDLLLMDFGCEYGNYAADLSRTIPVSGRYTERQKAVYNTVLHVQKEAYKLLRPGNTLDEYHREVGKIMEQGLIKLGLLDATAVKNQNPEQPLYKKYFMHGTSHHLGLNVHDYGDWYRKFEPGMVFTCEPGIYIPEENMGIRIENDVVITDGAPHDLMASIPREVEEIEALMNA